MARRLSAYPTELELEILKIIWRAGPSNVRQVRDSLVQFRQLAYTSVMTIMNIMTQKRYLSRAKKGRSYVYRPRVSRRATVRKMLWDMVERVFEGSAGAVMTNLLETSDIDAEELQNLRRLINDKIKGDPP